MCGASKNDNNRKKNRRGDNVGCLKGGFPVKFSEERVGCAGCSRDSLMFCSVMAETARPRYRLTREKRCLRFVHFPPIFAVLSEVGQSRCVGHATDPACLATSLKLWNWGRTRNWVYFLQGLPAFVMSIAVIVVVSKRYLAFESELEARYLDRARKSRSRPRRACRLSPCGDGLLREARQHGGARPPREPLTIWRIAYEQLRDWPKAFKLMSQIAPDNKPGYQGACLDGPFFT